MALGRSEPISVTRAVEAAHRAVGIMPTLVVTGEVSGFRGPSRPKNHCYFKVKDDSSSMDVIIWGGIYNSLGIELKDGLEILISGRFEVYQQSGKLSFIASKVEVAGDGLLMMRVQELARKLRLEGLMDDSRKRDVPRFCSRIVVVTSLSGSVIDDVKRTLARRNPFVEILVVGAPVQGRDAPAVLVRALAAAAAAHPDCILLVRGGGSYEDLMAFNDEVLVRAVASSPVPVVTGIGHEPDTTICDMVADRRASTPTAAAESVAPALDEVVGQINDREARLGRALSQTLAARDAAIEAMGHRAGQAIARTLSSERSKVESLSTRRCLTDPTSLVADRASALLMSEQRLHDALPRSLARKRLDLGRTSERLVGLSARILRPHEATLVDLASTLDALSPLKVLGRGYAIARDGAGHVISSPSQVAVGDTVSVLVERGTLVTRVVEARGSNDGKKTSSGTVADAAERGEIHE